MWSAILSLPAGVLTLLIGTATASLPYNPTTVLLSATNGSDLIYILQPTSDSTLSFQVLALNATVTLTTASIPSTTISTSLPFLNDDDGTSFTALIDSDGTILVYAGDCQEGTGGTALWSFTSITGSPEAGGTWARKNLTESQANGSSINEGTQYLSAGFVFSGVVNTTSNIYVFGGMCPNKTSPSVDDWQRLASYSDNMIVMYPELPTVRHSSASSYELSALSSRELPIPEAGFSLTPLEPTFFNTSGGNESSQQNFVLLGGHTESAFINMSQVAIFSLPEQTWSFLPINAPTSTTKTDLARRDVVSVDPRSGHTAILTPDGKQIVVFGGWVGNVTTPADPPLAVLELGQGYGGVNEWAWSIPNQQGTGLPKGTGLFGHSAVMLSGAVMMVVGGHSIPTSDNQNTKRTDVSLSTNNYFFNISSGSWLANYTYPASATGQEASPDSGGLTADKKAGIGTGLALALAAIFAVILVYLLYRQKLKHRREAREKELSQLAAGAERYHSSTLGLGGIDGRGGEKSAIEWMVQNSGGSREPYPQAPEGGSGGNFGEGSGWKEGGGSEAERTGLWVEIPSPTRGLRRSLHSRSGYQPGPWHENGRRNHRAGNIHRIDERDEYEEDIIEPIGSNNLDADIVRGVNNHNIARTLDPFQDPAPLTSNPTVQSRTPSPQSPARERELEQQSWANDWTAASALMQHQQAGRTSPDKTDRTSSTLSEQSTRSTLSTNSIQQSIGALGRSMSQRSATLFGHSLFSSTSETTDHASTFDSQGRQQSPRCQSQIYGRTQSLNLSNAQRRTNGSNTLSRTTSTFQQLRFESEALLGGAPNQGEISPSRTQSRASGWMGNMRRAFVGGDRSTSASPESGKGSAASSPTKYHHTEEGIPRRAVSAGAMLWRRRQGARDWDIEDNGDDTEGNASTDMVGAAEEEWDVESAVERRVVQVMFTVPKEKLRIVNGGPEGDGDSIVSMDREKASRRDESESKR
ncbi:hypothetical protein MMC06_005351 [Schaereria dolodes]|nr:hypothetical protein [Schaereria dolodes]